LKFVTVFVASVLVSILGSIAQGAPMPLRWSPSSRSPAAVPPSKKDVLAKLKTLQDKQLADSTELEAAIRKQLNETFKFEIAGDDLAIAGRRTNLVTKKIDELNKRRTELNARREIVDRIIFQVDSKWDGKSPLKDFFATTFLEMASNDLSDGRDNRLWKEFTFLSMTMREVPEKNEDVVSLFEGYLNFSNVLDPKTPAEYLASRNYTDGLESAQARVSDRSSLGDGLGPAPSGHGAPNVIRGSLAGDTQQVPPQPADSANSETVSGTTSSLAAPAASVPAPNATPIAKSKTESADKAQLDSGQVPMSTTQTAGKADSPDAAPLTTGEASRAATSTKATAQSTENLRVYSEKKTAPTPAPAK
jgi:hypothetical protein